MYKILIVEKEIQNIQKKNSVKNITINQLEKELKTKEYDLIYIENKFLKDKIEKIILSDYMLLPKALEKLAINEAPNNTYINLKNVNKYIINNTKIIEFRNYYEEMVISSIIKYKLINNADIKQIYKKICPNIITKIKVKKTVNEVVCKNYAANSILRKCKYYLFQKKIKKQFFDKILKNIEYDINQSNNL